MADPPSHLNYRPDIDGLRAVAVLSVLSFHAGLPFVPGGYVGVDVFFVISGFLITSIIAREIDGGTFSFARFYARRARRILPALCVVVLATAIASTWLLLPSALAAFGRSVASVALSASNILFWYEDGYFATSSEYKPLLHTWSLSLEEQFYLLHPVLLVVAHRIRPKARVFFIAAPLAASLGLSAWCTGRFDFAYYLLPARAWELLLGALVAVLPNLRLGSRIVRDGVGAVGLLLIAFSAVMFTNKTEFPGVAALLPCLGAALLIGAGGSGTHLAGRLLSLSPFVRVGKLSYSLYLWHWPLLVLPKYYLVRPLTLAESLLALAVALLLAELSVHFVEAPFRRAGGGTSARSPTRPLVASACTLAAIACAGGALSLTRGLPTRVSPEVLSLEETQVQVDIPDPSCLPAHSLSDVPERPGCFLGTRGKKPSFVLWGDSHSAALSRGLAHEAERAGRSGLLIALNGCPPLIGASMYWGKLPVFGCRNFSEHTVRLIEKAPDIETVVLVARWPVYVRGFLPHETAGDIGADPLLGDGLSLDLTDDERTAILERALAETAARLEKAGKRVILADPIPEIGQHVPTTLARLVRFHQVSTLDLSFATYVARNHEILSAFEHLAQQGFVTRISPERLLCDDSYCHSRTGTVALYADDDHLSYAGALRVASSFTPAFE
jgi:peptidoglycan/LPS O-acetylase OafA/YrhL